MRMTLTEDTVQCFFLQFVNEAEFQFFRNIEFLEKFGLSFGRILQFHKKNFEFLKKSLSFEEKS